LLCKPGHFRAGNDKQEQEDSWTHVIAAFLVGPKMREDRYWVTGMHAMN
jgi:hypothetical protein